MLYAPTALSRRSSSTGRKKLQNFLSARLTSLKLYLPSIILMRPYDVGINGSIATEVGFSLGLDVLTVGSWARDVCLRRYPFSLNVVLKDVDSL